MIWPGQSRAWPHHLPERRFRFRKVKSWRRRCSSIGQAVPARVVRSSGGQWHAARPARSGWVIGRGFRWSPVLQPHQLAAPDVKVPSLVSSCRAVHRDGEIPAHRAISASSAPRARCNQRLHWPPSRCWHRPRGPGPGPLPAGWCRSGAADRPIDQDQRNGPGHVRCHESGQMRPGLGHPALGEQRDARRQHRPRRRHRRPPEPFHPLLASRCRERPFPPAHAGHHPIASPGRRTPSPADPDGEAGRTPDADLQADPRAPGPDGGPPTGMLRRCQ